ncbi:MAG TPA: flavin prenyltransferase UbiX [Planctomycetaceae bacterium]|nr:flavin prenyltransferase UbiX [Planctomycetaceae bacterium]
MPTLVVAITGASGAVYAVRLLEVLTAAGATVHVTISPSGADVLMQELGISVDLDGFDFSQFVSAVGDQDSRLARMGPAGAGSGTHAISSVFDESDLAQGAVVYHHYLDFSAGIASGSFLTDGMIICPCSMGTLASIAHGHSSNLIHRAADVHLKERRKLIVVPRETPLSSIQLGNMQRLSEAGALVLPAMPGFYHNPVSIHDLIDFVVGRVCDQVGIRHELFRRWGSRDEGRWRSKS